jgi:PIN domain nuclease of toxin-antitoxin system
MRFVIDSSVLLAAINKESGGDKLVAYLNDSVIPVTTYTEVVTRLLDAEMPFDEAERLMSGFRLPAIDVTLALAKRAAEFRSVTRAYGLSIGDRICLAVAESLGATAVTADRQWAGVRLGIPIELIR